MNKQVIFKNNKTEAGFTKTEMNNEWNINFLNPLNQKPPNNVIYLLIPVFFLPLNKE